MLKDEKTKISFITTKEIHKLLIEESEYQDRSVSNLVSQIVKYYFKHKKQISLDE